MNIAVIGAGIAGLSAAWFLKQGGHQVRVFERNYKPGGRMNSRRKAGLVMDHGDRFISENSPVLQELIVDCGLHGEVEPIESPIFAAQPNGQYVPAREGSSQRKLCFPDGMLALPEALRRSLGGFYSIRVQAVEWDAVLKKYLVRTEPPLRVSETQADALVIACAASEAHRLTAPIHDLLRPEFLKQLKKVLYTKCFSLMAATEKVELRRPFYGLEIPSDSLLHWMAFEDRKCPGRDIPGWSSMVAHSTPIASEKMWKWEDVRIQDKLYEEARRLAPELPDKARWLRLKRWEFSSLAPDFVPLDPARHPDASSGNLVVFCGDYRKGNGVENAAFSGREAAEILQRRMDEMRKDQK